MLDWRKLLLLAVFLALTAAIVRIAVDPHATKTMRRALLAFLVIIDWGVVIWAEDANPLWLFGYQIVTLIVAGGVVARRVRTETAFALIVVGIIVAVAVLTEFGAKRGDLDAGSVYAVLESILLVYPVLRLVLDRRVRAAESVDESVDSSEPK